MKQIKALITQIAKVYPAGAILIRIFQQSKVVALNYSPKSYMLTHGNY